jgi:hypothetical protein
LPEGYAVPKSGGQYMKFKDGANKFRIGVMANKELRGWRSMWISFGKQRG